MFRRAVSSGIRWVGRQIAKTKPVVDVCVGAILTVFLWNQLFADFGSFFLSDTVLKTCLQALTFLGVSVSFKALRRMLTCKRRAAIAWQEVGGQQSEAGRLLPHREVRYGGACDGLTDIIHAIGAAVEYVSLPAMPYTVINFYGNELGPSGVIASPANRAAYSTMIAVSFLLIATADYARSHEITKLTRWFDRLEWLVSQCAGAACNILWMNQARFAQISGFFQSDGLYKTLAHFVMFVTPTVLLDAGRTVSVRRRKKIIQTQTHEAMGSGVEKFHGTWARLWDVLGAAGVGIQKISLFAMFPTLLDIVAGVLDNEGEIRSDRLWHSYLVLTVMGFLYFATDQYNINRNESERLEQNMTDQTLAVGLPRRTLRDLHRTSAGSDQNSMRNPTDGSSSQTSFRDLREALLRTSTDRTSADDTESASVFNT